MVTEQETYFMGRNRLRYVKPFLYIGHSNIDVQISTSKTQPYHGKHARWVKHFATPCLPVFMKKKFCT